MLEIGNKRKMKIILKINFVITFTLDKPLIKKVYAITKKVTMLKPSLHYYYKE
jgi:hypothetical protein